MYNAILKEHRAKTAATRKQVEAARHAALHSCEVVSANLYSEVQAGVGAIYANQRLLQVEAAQLQSHTTRFVRQSDRWLALCTALHTSLKELGDVHNWALTIQKDVRWVDRELATVVAENNARKCRIKEKREREMESMEEARRKVGGGGETKGKPSGATSTTAAAAAAAAPISPPHQTLLLQPVQPAASSPLQHEPHVHGADEELP